MRIGVLGGSFNPPHIGHLLIASDAYEALGLDRLLIIPAATNPLKAMDDDVPSAAERLQMVYDTFGDDPRFEVSAMEIERGGLSYTVDTLETLAHQNPGAELILMVGMDSLQTMDQWKRPERIRELATVAVLSRGDGASVVPEGVRTITTRRVDVSSTEIRGRVAAGLTIRGFVADSVGHFILTAKLYASTRAG